MEYKKESDIDLQPTLIRPITGRFLHPDTHKPGQTYHGILDWKSGVLSIFDDNDNKEETNS